jgi:GMP synthase-like glutamine amidotransferase
LAEALGGEVYGADFPEIGWHEVSLTEDGRISPLFQGLPSTFTTFHWHGDHYRLPEGTVSLAASLITPNQAFLGPGGRSLGIQFHPEYTPTLVQTYAARHGHEWTPGPYVQSRSEVLERLDCLRDTYWLLSALMNNFQALTGLR